MIWAIVLVILFKFSALIFSNCGGKERKMLSKRKRNELELEGARDRMYNRLKMLKESRLKKKKVIQTVLQLRI